ncbi:hypothetical protein PORY_000154 [Pneumocystis oryctolagi]|uniref:Uncharacterized protein n=1 Tax=Pneumocystis oryctolagi TaxID=42067 RepID=A0ACB7CEE5_9ASCO|nr:hypothetical protein PORY_000154 [Pneumocystis oryctolagi]
MNMLDTQRKCQEEEENDPLDDEKAKFKGILEKFRHTPLKRLSEGQGSSIESTQPLHKSVKKSRKNTDQDDESSTKTTRHNKQKRKTNRSYVPPEYYAHLPPGVPDVLGKNLIVIFIGLNPGIATVKAGHAFAGPTNLFWKLLHSSRIVCTETRLRPEDDVTLQKWSIGITNLVSRPTAGSNELSKEEMIEGVPILENKVSTFCPLSVCIVGKGIYEAIYKYKTGKHLKKTFEWGWQPEKMGASGNYEGALIYVVPSTSGRAASYSKEMKEKYWNIFGQWVAERRKERGESEDILNKS